MTHASHPRGRMPRSPLPRIGLFALALCALAGCDQTDPYQRVGVWRPSGANDANFELQVARASDLVMGRGAEEADGQQAAAAIERMRTDKMRPLPSTSLSNVGAKGTPTNGDK